MNVSHQNNLFNQTKIQILKNKFQYLKCYLNDTQNRVENVKQTNLELISKIKHLKKIKNQRQDGLLKQPEETIAQQIENLRREEDKKVKKLLDLKKLIRQYKTLCENAIGCKKNQSSNSVRNSFHLDQQKHIENQKSLDWNQIETRSNLDKSVDKSKSYKIIKTNIYCHECQHSFKPHEYYCHLQKCTNKENSYNESNRLNQYYAQPQQKNN